MDSCTYCGSTWNIVRDHVIPNSVLRSTYRKYSGDWLVPAWLTHKREIKTRLAVLEICSHMPSEWLEPTKSQNS